MADLLVRHVDGAVKDALAARAARNGRSQQAEIQSILEEALGSDSSSWVMRLHRAAQLADGIDLPAPERHPARIVDTRAWE